MNGLTGTVLRTAGRGRSALIVGCTAASSGLLLVAIAIARVRQVNGYCLSPACHEMLFGPVADPGTRGGAVFGVVLMTVPFVLLLDQAVRLGTSARERRYAALALAGATRRDLGRFGALEVGVPALLGSVAGWLVYLVLRAALSGPHMGQVGSMVPASVTPGWWGLLALGAVTAYGVWVGRRAGTRAGDAWMTWRGLRGRPRPTAALFLLGALLPALVIRQSYAQVNSTLVGIATIVLVVLGLAGLAPWAAWRVARWILPKVSDAATLLAVRRLMSDPRSAGRAAAATGAVATAGAAAAALSRESFQRGQQSLELGVSLVLVAVAVVVGLLLVAGSLSVRTVELLLERRRQMAALVATGVPEGHIIRSVRIEGLVATLPMAVLGVLVGGPGYLALVREGDALSVALTLVGGVLVLGLLVAAVGISSRVVQPWVRRALAEVNLRTE